jgi:hypothetical protein
MPEKNLALLLEAEKIAQLLNDQVEVARVQLWIGRAHYYGGKLKEAGEYYRKVLVVAPQLRILSLLFAWRGDGPCLHARAVRESCKC